MVYDVICDEYATLSENERVGERGKVIEYI